jgi:hypothetical protein
MRTECTICTRERYEFGRGFTTALIRRPWRDVRELGCDVVFVSWAGVAA